MPDTFNLPDEALTKAVEIIGEHTGETYDNLIQPASKETGFTLESIIKINPDLQMGHNRTKNDVFA